LVVFLCLFSFPLPYDGETKFFTIPESRSYYTWGDNYVILLTTDNCHHRNVGGILVLANRCVWIYTPVEEHGLPITLA